MRAAGYGQVEVRRVENECVVDTITPYQDRSFSALRLISDAHFQEGLERLRRDLLGGPVPAVSSYVMVWGRSAETRR